LNCSQTFPAFRLHASSPTPHPAPPSSSCSLVSSVLVRHAACCRVSPAIFPAAVVLSDHVRSRLSGLTRRRLHPCRTPAHGLTVVPTSSPISDLLRSCLVPALVCSVSPPFPQSSPVPDPIRLYFASRSVRHTTHWIYSLLFLCSLSLPSSSPVSYSRHQHPRSCLVFPSFV